VGAPTVQGTRRTRLASDMNGMLGQFVLSKHQISGGLERSRRPWPEHAAK
jgi:hypothetical protein